uniref:Aminodeoxychorismate synthase component 1 n=1 Tax=Lactococcus lactis subsp. lactis TaxID=1360 RepID=PABB_LACLL|nr:RecName: Full=Aminodeoxychorismate synthase component 1; Short=ADC synthase; Short=ADCS; AltName: Full=4-amino-4-deoxychorismate synthase component 1 [Lactococcus lactis subsp. lactis]AAA17025.1 p-aminobenzoic acid synthetase [Lactococcus lactis]
MFTISGVVLITRPVYDEGSLNYCQSGAMNNGILLESVEGNKPRYSIGGAEPIGTINANAVLTAATYAEDVKFTDADPLNGTRVAICNGEDTQQEEMGFQGGALGYFAYDVGRRLEGYNDLGIEDWAIPDLAGSSYEIGVSADHQNDVIVLIAHASADGNDVFITSSRQLSMVAGPTCCASGDVEILRNKLHYYGVIPFSQDDCGFNRLKDYLGSGDMYQVNLGNRNVGAIVMTLFQGYNQLRLMNPGPYMVFLDEANIIMASPEIVLADEANDLNTRPIAGTLMRLNEQDEDGVNAACLGQHHKDRAEHMMIVDLVRNDLGRVGRFGSVNVQEIVGAENYSVVMHIVSRVTGSLNEAFEAMEIIRAGFPGGSITGAPKVRAMEIIEELEPQRRDGWGGSIGYIAYRGNIGYRIAIRTLFACNGQLFASSGAGLVGDSMEDGEYNETFEKMRALRSFFCAAVHMGKTPYLS